MAKRIYVGNLSFDTTEDGVRELFSQYGNVDSISLITDRETGRPRGFGFVEMSEADANTAIKELDGTELDGRTLKVNEARERTPRGGGGGGGGGRGRSW